MILVKPLHWFLNLFGVQYRGDFVQCLKDLANSNAFLVFCLLLFLLFFFIYISNRLLSVLTIILLLRVLFDIEDEVENLTKGFNNMIVKVQDGIAKEKEKVFGK